MRVFPQNTICPRVAFITCGCAKNEVDTKNMAKRLFDAGFDLVDDASCADALIINTCAFIQSATEHSIETIFDAVCLPNVRAGAALIVAGCMPSRYGDDLACALPEAHAFVPCNCEEDIVAYVKEALTNTPFSHLPSTSHTTPKSALGPSVTRENNMALPACVLRTSQESISCADTFFIPPVWAYVKISDGCNRFCSYCTIPFIRGRYHSFSYEYIYGEVEKLVQSGAREIILIAQDTGCWGCDFKHPSSLAQLVSGLAEAFKDVWFRIMYTEPEGVSDELIDAMATHANICNYLDIPLQHVDANILHAMNRKGSRAEFELLINRIRACIPDIALRTTLIAGFPGERDEQFESLCDFVEEGMFDYVGVFPYSPEEGTRAALLPDQIADDEKLARAQRLRDIADSVCYIRVSERVGKEFDVIVEGCEEDGQLFGRAQCQAPEVDGVVYIDKGKPGSVQRIIVTDTLLYEMEGQHIDE